MKCEEEPLEVTIATPANSLLNSAMVSGAILPSGKQKANGPLVPVLQLVVNTWEMDSFHVNWKSSNEDLNGSGYQMH